METEILQALRSLKLPKDYRRGVRKSPADNKRGGMLGIVQEYGRPKYTSSCLTRKYPQVAKLLCEYVKNQYPAFNFTSIQINQGGCALHVDTLNQGKSLIVSFGDHSGGELYEYPDKITNIKNRLHEFSGLVPHMTLPFEGERYSVVFFSLRPYKIPLPEKTHQALLDDCGFSPLPAKVKERPRTDLLETAAGILENELHISKDHIGDWTNKSIPSIINKTPKSAKT